MPPNKKKKEPKNGFFFFMQHFRKEQEERGIRYNGMQEVADAAGPKWSEMTTLERAPFEEMARIEKQKDKADMENKYTTTGLSYAQVERMASQKSDFEKSMISEVTNTIHSLEVPNGLVKHAFYFIHVNFYCRMECGTYIPCEIAVARFTLRKGIDDTFHAIITQDRVPMGYNFEAKKTSEESHEIPLPPNPDGETDYYKLFLAVKSFLQEENGSTILPPLYTLPMHLDPVRSVLKTLEQSSARHFEDLFRVYPLPLLFHELRNACSRYADTTGFPVQSLAERELDKDVFNFTPGISCDFHEHKDSVQYCSLSIVKRWCFLIADHSCQDVGVQLVPGTHVPLFSDTARNFVRHQQEAEGAVGGAIAKSLAPKSKAKAKPKTITVVDHSKDPPSEKATRHYNVSSPLVEDAWGFRRSDVPTAPLRQPRSDPIAMAGVLTNPSFTEDDFPPFGEQGGVFGRLPVAVAGRGRPLPQPQPRTPTTGRGRGLAASFSGLGLNESAQ